MAAARPHPRHLRNIVRPYLAVLLIVTWLAVAATGFLLWAAPEGRQSGRQELWLGLTKSGWSDIHLWVAVAVIAVTIAHLIVDWRALRGAMRHLINPPQR